LNLSFPFSRKARRRRVSPDLDFRYGPFREPSQFLLPGRFFSLFVSPPSQRFLGFLESFPPSGNPSSNGYFFFPIPLRIFLPLFSLQFSPFIGKQNAYAKVFGRAVSRPFYRLIELVSLLVGRKAFYSLMDVAPFSGTRPFALPHPFFSLPFPPCSSKGDRRGSMHLVGFPLPPIKHAPMRATP